MSDPTRDMANELASVLSRYGVRGLSQELTRGGVGATAAGGGLARQTPGAVASYIREIITGDQAFDEQMLGRVAGMLMRGAQP